jgi:hypothetical protein
MKTWFKRYGIVVSGFLICLISMITPVQAQHGDVFKLGPGGQGDPTKRAKLAEAAGIGSIKVEDRYTYEVPIENKKIADDDVLRTDIDLVNFADEKERAAYQWHQVEVLAEIDITQVHTRTAGKLKCVRKRKGIVYWAPDDVKYIGWETWSSWSCTKE